MIVGYRVKTASEKDIFSCLSQCSSLFIKPLENRVNIPEYSKKLFEKSVTFEAWNNNNLLGFVAVYFNDTAHESAFISNVSILKKYQGLGIASNLLDMCFTYARKHNVHTMALEVFKEDMAAVSLYTKHGFKKSKSKKDMVVMEKDII